MSETNDNGYDMVAMLAGAVNGEVNMLDQTAIAEDGSSIGRVPNAPDRITQQDITGVGMSENATILPNTQFPSDSEIGNMFSGGGGSVAQPMIPNKPQNTTFLQNDAFVANLNPEIYQMLIKNNLLLEKVYDILYSMNHGKDTSGK